MEFSIMDAFLYMALRELSGEWGRSLAYDLYDFIVHRDGSCPYSVDDIEEWIEQE